MNLYCIRSKTINYNALYKSAAAERSIGVEKDEFMRKKCIMIRISAFITLCCYVAFGYNAPFITNAEKLAYINDATGVIESSGDEILIFYPGVESITANGLPVTFIRRNKDLISVTLPPGKIQVELTSGSDDISEKQHPVLPDAVSAPDALQRALAVAVPGDEVIIRNGIYVDWNLTLSGSGAAGKPIVIRPETPGGVIFSGHSGFTVTGSYIEIREFIFDQTHEDALILGSGRYNRITQCQFFFCGPLTNTFLSVMRLDPGSDFSRVDHCYFTGSKGMSLKVFIPSEVPETAPQQPQLDHNVFRDIFRIWRNGQENIQIGQHRPYSGSPRAVMEFNLFDNASADNEICSLKSHDNIVRYNVFANCRESGFVFRGGKNNRFEGNIAVRCTEALRMFDENHVIVNNLIMDCLNAGVVFQGGHSDGIPSKTCLIANNTIVNCPVGIGVGRPPDSADLYPAENQIVNNIIVSSFGTLIKNDYFQNFIISNNLLYASDIASVGFCGADPILKNPELEGAFPFMRPSTGSPAVDAALSLNEVQLDRHGRRRPEGKAPDIGADEIGAEIEYSGNILPEIPEMRTWTLSDYTGTEIFSSHDASILTNWSISGAVQNTEQELRAENAEFALNKILPEDFVLEFNYRPESFSSEASVTFPGSTDEVGEYRLVWGGAADDGKPSGVIRLYKSGIEYPVAEHPDLCLVRANYVYSWPGLIRINRDDPEENLWYRIQIVRRGARIAVYMNRAAPNSGANPRGVTQPVMIWDDTYSRESCMPGDRRLNVRQIGSGRWMNLRIWNLKKMPEQSGMMLNITSILSRISFDFNTHSVNDVIFEKGPKFNYSRKESYAAQNAKSNDLVFFVGSNARALIQDKGAGHEKVLFLNGGANFSQPNLGIYFVNMDMTAGGYNKNYPIRISWSFDILGTSDDPNFDSSDWEILVNYKNSDPFRNIDKLNGSIIAQTFSFNNSGKNECVGWKTISGHYDIPVGAAAKYGALQIRGTKGEYVGTGKGLLCLDNMTITITPLFKSGSGISE